MTLIFIGINKYKTNLVYVSPNQIAGLRLQYEIETLYELSKGTDQLTYTSPVCWLVVLNSNICLTSY
jgi:hypothetical protein